MDEIVITTPKKTTRTKKTASAQDTPAQIDTTPNAVASAQMQIVQDFDELVTRLIQTKGEFDNLQKEIAQMKTDWAREQKQHELELVQQKTQKELERQREQETYQYSTSLLRKRSEDEFQDRKLAWEKELSQKKEELAKEKQELEQLRKLTADFDNQKEAAVKDAEILLEKRLTEEFETEKRLREQEIKAEKDIFGLKIVNLESENSRFTKEIEVLKRSLDEATRQVKEIAVKVIESGSSQVKPQVSSQE